MVAWCVCLRSQAKSAEEKKKMAELLKKKEEMQKSEAARIAKWKKMQASGNKKVAEEASAEEARFMEEAKKGMEELKKMEEVCKPLLCVLHVSTFLTRTILAVLSSVI